LRLEEGVSIGPSNISNAGLGLFSTIARRTGDRIVPYAGKRVKLKSSNSSYGGAYVLELSPVLFIDAAAPFSGPGRYSNTARARNIASGECRGNNAHFTINRRTGTAWITATRPIKEGEEVLTAYGRGYRMPSNTADDLTLALRKGRTKQINRRAAPAAALTRRRSV
jgi:hypothetical protein